MATATALKLFVDPDAPPTLHRRCPYCDMDNAHERRLSQSRGMWQLKACRLCGFVYLENPPGYDALAEDFVWERSFQAERKTRREGHFLHYMISDSLKWLFRVSRGGRRREVGLVDSFVASGCVLDVGCASGATLARLPERFIPFGIEISPALAQEAEAICTARNGTTVRNNALGGLARFDADFFEGVLMISFLEHEIHPRAALIEAGRVLRPGGTLIIKVPNHASLNRRMRGARWCGYRYPDHVNYFTPVTLPQMVEGCGLTLRRFQWNDRLPLSDNMWVIAEKPAAAVRIHRLAA
jgi:SAM-dependent methyltransferase